MTQPARHAVPSAAKSNQHQQRLLAAFPHPEGTPVVVRFDDGTERRTTTRSRPWMLGANSQGEGGHTAVVLLDGFSGAYALERVRIDEVSR